MGNRAPNSRSSSVKVSRRPASPHLLTVPWALLVLGLVAHGVVGLLLSVFSPPYWVWLLAFAGTLVQALALAGPRALASLKGWWILVSRFITCLGTALSVVALGIAVGFGGTADIDQIDFLRFGLALLSTNLGILLLTAGCSLLIAYTGDRLLAHMGRSRCSLSILSVCFLGLFIGGALGLAIASSW